MTPDFLKKASGLWTAQLAHKASILGFSFLVGRSLDAAGVGVMATVLALCWIVGTIAGVGMPDRAVFRGAAEDLTAAHRRLYGLFLGAELVAHSALFLSVELLCGTSDPALVALSQGLIVGAGAQSMSSLGLGWLRGAGRPRFEIVATVLAALVLVGGASVGVPLGVSWAASGCVMLAGSLAGNLVGDGITPLVPRPSDGPQMVSVGTGYLLFGLGAWLLGNVDILLARLSHTQDAVGALQVGTMPVRGLGLVPWVAATLMLHGCRRDWSRGASPRTWAWVRNGTALGLLVAALAWIAVPLLARGHGIPVAAVERSAWASMIFAPVLYATILLMPLSAQWSMGGTLRAVGMGLITQVGVGISASDQLDVSTVVVVAGLGQLVTLLWLVRTLSSSPHQGVEVNASTALPGVGLTSNASSDLASLEGGSVQVEE